MIELRGTIRTIFHDDGSTEAFIQYEGQPEIYAAVPPDETETLARMADRRMVAL